MRILAPGGSVVMGFWVSWCWDEDFGSWWECGDGCRNGTIPQIQLDPHPGKCPRCALALGYKGSGGAGRDSPTLALPARGDFSITAAARAGSLPGDGGRGMDHSGSSPSQGWRIIPCIPCCPSSFPGSSSSRWKGQAEDAALRWLGTVPVCFIKFG